MTEFYHSTELGAPNDEIALGNPLRGLAGGSRWAALPLPELVPFSIEWFNIGMKEIMVGENEFTWDLLDDLLAGAALRGKHCAMSLYIHWPQQELQLPEFLSHIPMFPTDESSTGPSPDYQNLDLLRAMEQLIRALGERYDGDKRILTVHISLVGFWGEFHTYPYDYLAESTKESVVTWFRQSFTKTKLQARYPRNDTKGDIGYYDASFCYTTLDGDPNGGTPMSWYFWPKVQDADECDAWKTALMGGEVRPELQSTIFTKDYPSGTFEHQEFDLCASTTHMTYLLHHHAFCKSLDAAELELTKQAHAFLGYKFVVTEVSAIRTDDLQISVSVRIAQNGIAPFYYDLAVELRCEHWKSSPSPGVEHLIRKGDSATFVFHDVPVSICETPISIHLVSSYAYDDHPVLFAQGSDGVPSFFLPRPIEGELSEEPDTCAA